MWYPDTGGWTRADHFMAAQIEVADLWGRLAAQTQGVKPSKLPKQIQIPRPKPRRVERDPQTIRKFFDRLH